MGNEVKDFVDRLFFKTLVIQKKSFFIIKREVIDCGLYIPERHINRE